jgi:hypothetical protein
MIKLLSIALLALSVTVSSEAFADDASGLGDDEISLKNGGMVRGTVIAVEPGKEATIVIKGKEKTFSWAEIDKVDRGKYKEDSADAPKKPKKKPKKESDEAEDDEENLEEPVKGAPFLHIQATHPDVQLMRIRTVMTVMTSRGSASGIASETVCPAPCDRIVDARDGAQFYFTAPNMTPSPAIKLAPYEGEVEARIKGGSAARSFGGAWLLVGGITSGVMGAITLPIGLGVDVDELTLAGGIALGAAVVLIIPGALLVTSSRTTVEIVPRTAKSAGVRFENGALRF